MTENERFKYVRNKYKHYVHDTEKDGEWKKGYIGTYGEFDLDKITIELNKRENKINHLKNENEQLKSSLDFCRKNVKRLNDNKKELNDENEQLKSLLSEISDENDRILLKDGRIIQLRKVFKGEWK